MIKHSHTETSEINFAKLEQRLWQINNSEQLTNFNFVSHLKDMPTLIVATGGSKAVSYYLKLFLEARDILCEAIEPRDYFYKENIHNFGNLIVISNSGTSNGVSEILKSFPHNSYLITSDYVAKKEDESLKFTTIYWSNSTYDDREKSFISLIPTLAPMLMLLEESILSEENKAELSREELTKINNKLKLLMEKSQEIVANLHFNFHDTNLIQVMSGYDTMCSAAILESCMIETGAMGVVLHDKGSFCHGRSNLIFNNPQSPIIYLAHQTKKLDNELLAILKQEYPHIFLFSTLDEDTSIFWKEYYLALQMYYLAKKIAEDKGVDLTMPEYNLQVVRKLYRYRGEM